MVSFKLKNSLCTRINESKLQILLDWVVIFAYILWQDVASWQKEIDAYTAGTAKYLVNAVSVVMRLHDVEEEAAKTLLWDEVLEYERRYCKERDLFIQTHSPGAETCHWFRLLEFFIGGNAIWCSTTPRFHQTVPKSTRPESLRSNYDRTHAPAKSRSYNQWGNKGALISLSFMLWRCRKRLVVTHFSLFSNPGNRRTVCYLKWRGMC